MVRALAVGAAIKDIRQKKLALDATYTQEHVAHESSTSLRHYQKIEAGTVDMKLSTLYLIADVLGVTPQQVLDRAIELRRGTKGPRRR